MLEVVLVVEVASLSFRNRRNGGICGWGEMKQIKCKHVITDRGILGEKIARWIRSVKVVEEAVGIYD